jgi:hypothetical protein
VELGQLREAPRGGRHELVVEHIVAELVERACRQAERLELARQRARDVDPAARRAHVVVDRAVAAIEPPLPQPLHRDREHLGEELDVG